MTEPFEGALAARFQADDNLAPPSRALPYPAPRLPAGNRHSTSAAERFALHVSRLVRCVLSLKRPEIQACTALTSAALSSTIGNLSSPAEHMFQKADEAAAPAGAFWPWP